MELGSATPRCHPVVSRAGLLQRRPGTSRAPGLSVEPLRSNPRGEHARLTGLNKTWVALGLGAAAVGSTAFGRRAMLAIARKLPWVAALLFLEDLIVGLENPSGSVIGTTEGGKEALAQVKKTFADLKKAVEDFAGVINGIFGIDAERGKQLEALMSAFGEWAQSELVRFVEDISTGLQNLAAGLEAITWALRNPDEAWTKFADAAIEQIDRVIYAVNEKLGGALVRFGIIPSGRTGTWEPLDGEKSSGPTSRPNNRPGANKGFGGSGATGTWEESSAPNDGLRLGVYDAFRNAGYSHEGALALAAEVGRENSFRPDLVYGSHTDPHNKRRNSGFFSWQKDRGDKLMAFLKSRGLVTAGGKIKRGQASLDAMAEFTAREMGGMAPDLDRGLRNGSLSYAQANRGLGKRYIKWRYDDPRYAHHHRFRDQHRNRVAALVEKRGEPRPIVSENAGVMLQNYAGNSARLGNSTAAALGTITSRNQAITNHITTTVNQTVQNAVQAPKAVADAVGDAASGRAQQVARIAAEPAAMP